LVVAVVGIHVYHGAWSVFQTLGWNNADRNGFFRGTAFAIGAGLFLAFASVPVMFWSGVMPAPAAPTSLSTPGEAVDELVPKEPALALKQEG
jgi:succinate dehydrogenase / fumarate reductase cytochrome b subunit